MPWANLDDNFPDHPKVAALSDGAFRLHTSGIVYCARYLTDGKVPKVQVPGLSPTYRPVHLRELVAAGLWKAQGNHYIIHDYLQWNRSKAQVEAERDAKSRAGKKGAQNRWAK